MYEIRLMSEHGWVMVVTSDSNIRKLLLKLDDDKNMLSYLILTFLFCISESLHQLAKSFVIRPIMWYMYACETCFLSCKSCFHSLNQ